MDDCRIPDPVFPMTSDQDELESHRLWPEWLQLNLRVARDVAFITGGSVHLQHLQLSAASHWGYGL
ncbi:MAG: hypothetical protein NQU45_07960 [Methanothermobacter sp.]|nr:hypothetical protein [Methanothermobacter sp.]